MENVAKGKVRRKQGAPATSPFRKKRAAVYNAALSLSLARADERGIGKEVRARRKTYDDTYEGGTCSFCEKKALYRFDNKLACREHKAQLSKRSLAQVEARLRRNDLAYAAKVVKRSTLHNPTRARIELIRRMVEKGEL